MADIGNNDWFKYYIYAGVDLGFFKGKSTTSFAPNDNLNRAAMAKVIVNAALKLGLYDIDVSTTGGTFSDVSTGHWAFPYIQTLRNKGYISLNTKFNPDSNITAAQFAKILCNGLQLNNSDINANTIANGNGISGSKINYTCSDQTLQTYINRINEIVTVNGNYNFVERLASGLFPASSAEIQSTSILANGTNYVNRKLMSKVLLNAYNFKYTTSLKSSLNISNYTVIGDKFEIASSPTGNQPVSISGNITMASGETRDIGTNSDYQDGNLLYFYWTVDGGTLTTLSQYPNFRKVNFVAPTVSSNTDYHLYFLSGTSEGEINEAYITITVTPPTGPTAPTIQSSNINFTSVNYSSITFNWSRGNGAYCIVTLTPQGSTVNNPVDGTVYTGNSNFTAAPAISGSSTKVVYTGTGNSLTVSGLQSNIYYIVDIYEYNADTPSEAKYLVSGHLTSTCHIPQIPTTTVDFNWDPNPIIAGSVCNFYSLGSNYTDCSWTFAGANITASSAISVPNVVFSTAGVYNVTLTNYNSNTGLNVSITKQITVYAATYSNPDLIITNLSCSATTIMAGNTMNISYTVSNVGLLPSSSCQIRIYVCDYDTIDLSRELMGSFTVNALEPNESVSYTFTSYATQSSWTGTKYLIASVDDDGFGGYIGHISECNENNNQKSMQINFLPHLPDYSLSNVSVTPSTIQSGGQLMVNYTLSGVESFNTCYVTFLINTDSTLNGAQDAVYGWLDPQQSNGNKSHTVKFSSYLPSGNYWVIVFADGLNAADETNENNNIVYYPIVLNNPNQPTIPSSNFQLNNITNNSATLSWTNGNGIGRVVIASTSYPPFPVDGIQYTANTDFTQGSSFGNCNTAKVVYNGASSSVNITGLITNSDYYFSVIEYNGTGSSIDYLQTDGLASGSCQFTSAGILANINSANTYSNGWAKLTNAFSYQDNYGSSSLYFKSDQIGWAAGVNGELFKTTDGGITWKYKYFNFVTRVIFFIGNNGWIGGTFGNLYKTTDNGITWNMQPAFTNKCITGMFFVDSNLGYCVTADNSNDYAGEIYKTTNGGTNWYKLLDVPTCLSSVCFVNSNTGWVSGRAGTILKTTDGGQSWTSEISGCGFGVIKSLCFLNADTGYAVNYWTSNVIRTIDGGNTWNQLNITGTNKYGVTFLNDLSGYVYGNYEINKTIDGGQTWTTYPLSFDPTSFFSIDENNAFASYQGIYKTNTGSQLQFINNTVVASSYCIPTNFNINYTLIGTFNNGNVFKAEISDASGSFINPVTIGTITSMSNGTINCNIPIGIANGSNYKIRISATNPATTGAESNAFSINQTPVVNINGLQNSYLTTASDVTLTNLGSPLGGTFTINGTPAAIFSPSALGAGSYNVVYAYSTYQNFSYSTIPAVGTYAACPTNNIYSLTCNTTNNNLYSGNLLQLMVYNIDSLGNIKFRIKKNSGTQFTAPGTFEIRDSISGNCWSVAINVGVTFGEITINEGNFTGTHQFIGLFRYSLGSYYYAGTVAINGVGQNLLCPNQISKTVTVSVPNAINTANINPTSYCAGSTINVPYTTTGNFISGNQFFVELSDGVGSFANPTVINSVASVTSGSVSCTLPVSALYGTSYKIRVSSTNPSVTGVAGNSFTINVANIPAISIVANNTTVCANTIVGFTASPTNGGVPVYQWKVNGTNAGTNSAIFNTSTLQNGDFVQVQMTSNMSCAIPASLLSNPISIIVNNNVMPTAYIEADRNLICNNEDVNIWSYVDNEGSNPVYQWKMNGTILPSSLPFFTIGTLSNDADISLRLISNASCLIDDTVVSNIFHIGVGATPITPVISIHMDSLISNASNGNQWYNQAGIIIGATNSYYIPTAQGNYYVITNNGACYSDTSNIINLIFTGVHTIDLQPNVSIYPNPVRNELIIEISGDNENVGFEIYNSLGQVVSQVNVFEKTVVKTNDFKSGIYLIKLVSGKTVICRKIVKE